MAVISLIAYTYYFYKEGYLDKVHTSSGRVPSAKGYRLYVDELLKEQNLSLEETKYIKDKLEIKVNEIATLTSLEKLRRFSKLAFETIEL